MPSTTGTFTHADITDIPKYWFHACSAEWIWNSATLHIETPDIFIDMHTWHGLRFCVFFSLAVHQAQVQNEKDESASANFQVKPEPQVFKCSTPGCNQEFPDKQHQVDHERRCEMKRYPCTFPGCDRRFRNSKQRHTHVSSVHRRSEPGFKCSVPECTATFRAADKLKVHESRCRFKYVTLQQMAMEGGENHLQNPVTEGIVINVPAENFVKLGNCDGMHQVISTVDMSLVKAEGFKGQGS